MTPKRLIAIGASAGGIEALRTIAGSLPADFPAPICVVLHTSPTAPALLSGILDRAGPLRAVAAHSGARLKPGTIYVAPPDRHLIVEPGKVRLTRGPKENRFRPAIDPLFRSTAQVYGPNGIGVVLTGHLDDGAAGLWAVKQLGGIAIVQDPADALFPSMPDSAMRYVDVDHVVPLDGVAPLLVRLTTEPARDETVAVLESVEVEVDIAKEKDGLEAGLLRIATPSEFTCPECHGVLMQLKEGDGIRFRCHTGHAYSVQTLLAAIHDGVEDALWASVRAMHEGERLMQQMAEHLRSTPHAGAPADLHERVRELRRRSDILREMLTTQENPAGSR